MFEMFGKGVALDDVVCPHSSSELTTSRYLLTNLPKYLNCNCLLLIAFTTGILLQVPSRTIEPAGKELKFDLMRIPTAAHR